MQRAQSALQVSTGVFLTKRLSLMADDPILTARQLSCKQ